MARSPWLPSSIWPRAMVLGSDGAFGRAGALLLLCFIGAMYALIGSLCSMGMSRIIKWKRAQRS